VTVANAWKRSAGVSLALVVLLVGCAPAQNQGGGGNAPQAQQPTGPKRITAAMMGNPAGVTDNFIGGGSGGGVPGQGQFEELIGGALVLTKERALQLTPSAAEAVPSVENGLWRVFPDGRMETTWKIRNGTRWHDGTPFTSADLLFTTKLEQDKTLPVQRKLAYDYIASIDAPDPQTITVAWSKPFIEADAFFSTAPLPRHILEQPYMENNRDAFIALPFWTSEFVGIGAYRITDWVRDSHVVLQAFDAYPLGRPKIDEIVVKFLADENAFIAAILAGTVDVTIGKSINFEQAMEIQSQWSDGHVEVRPETVVKMWPQFLDPNPVSLLDPRLRKALMYGVNRQEMVDGLVGRNASQVAHSILLSNEEIFQEGEATAVKYEYDPRRAADLIEQLGYAKGPDGVYRDAGGQLLSVEVQATDEAQNTKPMFAVADAWKRMGIDGQAVVIPIQRQNDRQYRATFSGFNLQGSGSGVARIKELTSSQARLPENNYTGRNYPRYANPEFDAMVDRLFSSISHQDRVRALQQVIQHMTDQVVMVPLYYAPMPTLLSNRLVNAGFDPTWNAHEWDSK
jgi:peptide/nickel transport system substrate-binding protein